eukprot:754532-Hanusia_phi.AAC.6
MQANRLKSIFTEAGRMSGRGKMVYANGDVYDGFWHDGKREGEGSYFSLATESEYLGEFKKGKRHGYGKQQHVVAAPSNIKTSLIPYKTTLSETYEGEWSNGRKHGFGRILVRSRKVFEGNFLNDCKHGEGVEFFDDGSTFKSMWQEGVSQGAGILRLSDGTSVRGYWEGENFREVVQERFVTHDDTKEAEAADGLMEFFERGKLRILGNQPSALDTEFQPALEMAHSAAESTALHDRASLSSMGGLHDIEEVDEEQMVDSGSHGPTPIPNHSHRSQGRASAKSSPYSPPPAPETKRSAAMPGFHDDLVDIAKRHDVLLVLLRGIGADPRAGAHTWDVRSRRKLPSSCLHGHSPRLELGQHAICEQARGTEGEGCSAFCVARGEVLI